MFGPSIRTVFTSRWKALMWSAGILMTAYCSIPSADETDGGNDASVAQAREAQAALEAITGKQADDGDSGDGDAHRNPWSKDKD